MKKQAVALKVLLITLLMGFGNAQAQTVPEVPDNLRPPKTEVLSAEVWATGVQIYECKAGAKDTTRFEWVFKAPEAQLLDSTGKIIGKHYAGPTWELNDGSKVVGEIKAQHNGPDPTAIPWLLLNAKSTSASGIFSRTKSIQRLNTVGGKAPAEGCVREMAGTELRVPYKATYYFYGE